LDFRTERLLKERLGSSYKEFLKSLESQDSFERFLLKFLINKRQIKIVKEQCRGKRQFVIDFGKLTPIKERKNED